MRPHSVDTRCTYARNDKKKPPRIQVEGLQHQWDARVRFGSQSDICNTQADVR